MIEHLDIYQKWAYPVFFACVGGIVRQVRGKKESDPIEEHVPRLRFWFGELIASAFSGLCVHEVISYFDVPVGLHVPLSGMAGYCNREVLSMIPAVFSTLRNRFAQKIGIEGDK